ncbi:MAG: DUF998 domain-containing protein [Actinomycetota bacterium]|nr:DUF998 domain-containing protein [Actinomycetota bacterium]
MIGPVLFTAVLLALTSLQYDFMIGIGWRPLADPSGAWPSGLALGPYGSAQVANFVISGFLLALFAVGLHLGVREARGSQYGTALLVAAGVLIALMGFETDPIRRVGPRSWHGMIHDAAFVLFVFAFLAALFLLWRRFEADPLWQNHARYTLLTGVLAMLLLLLPGVAYYLFVATLLAWIEVSALRLWRLRL